MNESRIAVHLTPQEIESFKQWRKHQDMFEILLKGKVFEPEIREVIIYRTRQGAIKDIFLNQNSYSRKK